MSQINVLYLPLMSDSLYHRPYLDELGGVTLLQWFISWFLSVYPDLPFTVLCHKSVFGDEAAAMARSRGSCIHLSRRRSQAEACEEVCEAFDADHLALLPLCLPLGPWDLLRRVWDHHFNTRNDCTEVTNFTAGVVPEIYSRSLIGAIAGLPVPGAGGALRTLVQALLNTRASTGEDLPIPLKAAAFDAARSYGAGRDEVPLAAEITTRNGLQFLFPLLRSYAGTRESAPSLDGLRAVKVGLIQKHAVVSQKLRRAALSGAPWLFERGSVSGDVQRVLYVSNASAFSGAEETLCRMMEHVDPARYRMAALVAAAGEFSARLKAAGAEVFVAGHEFGDPSAASLLYLLAMFRKIRPDILHYNGQIGPAAVQAAALYGAPLVQHVRTSEMAPLRDALQTADAVIAVSKYIRQQVLSEDVDPKKVTAVYDGIDLERFDRTLFDVQDARSRHGIPPRARVVLMVARYAPNKRHDVLVAAGAEVRRAIPGLHLVFVGEVFSNPELADALRLQIREAGMSDAVTFLDFQSDIRSVEMTADVQVLCSENEALGTCILESMALEIPVMVTDSGGLQEIVRNGEDGYVVPYGDSHALAVRLMELLGDDAKARQLGRAGRNCIRSRAEVASSARAVMDVYHTVAAPVPAAIAAAG